MKKSIEISKGDEYRAKIERELKKGTLFEDVYKKANDIVIEIIRETKELRNRDENQMGCCKNFQDMSNNIVAFCAERGQGKTSAMQSFAAYLRGEMKVESISKEGEVFNKSDYHFEVLDSIDPSALNSGESIVRVLISRLFYKLDQDFKELPSHCREENGKLMLRISELFEHCYTNIDYLCRNTKPDQNDLDFLAQLGNSARLKRNLYELVEACLEVAMRNGDKKKIPYLVVQIDDADLSMCDIFNICEDIRIYLSIPNVIVLMAADYEQLRYAVYQRYLIQYKNLIRLQSLIRYEDKCSEMASRYLEKMIPSGHKIALPVIERLISESYQELKVCYYHTEEDLFAGEEFLSCQDIQEQLLKLLYMKTGIVLLKQKENRHPFLPHTLRELTHFLKLLNEMDTVNFELAYQIIYYAAEPGAQEGQVCVRELEKLRENLSVLKEYFLKYWCGNNLDALQYKLLKDIDRENQNGQMKAVYKCISLYLQKRGGKLESSEKITYKNLMSSVVGNLMKDEPELQMAIHLYYTIFLNEWFAAAAERTEQFEDFVRFIESPFDLSDKLLKKKYRGKYHIMQFDVHKNKLEANLSKVRMLEGATANWLENFCIPILGNGTEGEPFMKMVEEIDGVREWNSEIVKLRFNIFQPILSMLLNTFWMLNGAELEKKNESTDENSSELSVRETKDVGYLLSVKNIVANYEVQNYIQNKLIKICMKMPRRKRDQAWSSVCNEIYEAIDSWIEEEASYLMEDSQIRKVCYAYLSNRDLGDAVFSGNEENMEQYFNEYKSKLKQELCNQKSKLQALEEGQEQELAYTELLIALGEDASKKKIAPQIAAIPENIENTKLKGLKRLEDEWRTVYDIFKKSILESEQEDPEGRKRLQREKIKEYKSKIKELEFKLSAARYPA